MVCWVQLTPFTFVEIPTAKESPNACKQRFGQLIYQMAMLHLNVCIIQAHSSGVKHNNPSFVEIPKIATPPSMVVHWRTEL
jgi:hypothetical protein